MTKKHPEGLALLREPFPENLISKLPKPTARQTKEVKDDFKKGIRCKLCGQWHHPDVVHLDYVGHAALTDRLLDCDQEWNWEPLSYTEHGIPAIDNLGGMWIKLTVCGVTRLGYGDAQGKQGPNAVKEVIGDALRNAAMRFGAALDLWHKGDLHGTGEGEDEPETADPEPPFDATAAADRIKNLLRNATDLAQLADTFKTEWPVILGIGQVDAALKTQIEKLKDQRKADLGGGY